MTIYSLLLKKQKYIRENQTERLQRAVLKKVHYLILHGR